MTKGRQLGICPTCGREIIEFKNDGVYHAGECEDCEWTRYRTQPDLLEACYAALELQCPDEDDHECGTFVVINEAIAKAEGE